LKITGRWLVSVFALALIAGACSSSEETTTTSPPTTEAPSFSTTTEGTTPSATATTAPGTALRSVEAPAVSISVDGDVSDWDGVAGLDVTLEPIVGEDVDPLPANVKAAHDDEFLYVLFSVEDDFNWDAADAHMSGAAAVMWAIENGAGPHMGVEDEDGEGPSLGMVDIWHWELECALGENQGGAVAGPGEGHDAGNDSGCNFDDEWSTDPETREDDNSASGENSLLGVFNHTNATDDGAGTWYFEMRRPLDTGDSQDAQFAAGSSALLALAYWDPDSGPDGWEDDLHLQSSNQGWIQVLLGR